MDHNTICALKVTSPTTHMETATIHLNCTESQKQVDNGKMLISVIWQGLDTKLCSWQFELSAKHCENPLSIFTKYKTAVTQNFWI